MRHRLVTAMLASALVTIPHVSAQHPRRDTPLPHPASAQEWTEALDHFVQPYVDARLFNGVVLVARGDSTVIRRAYGTADYALSVPMTTEHRFKIGSITKDITAVCLFELQRAGRLSLDDPVARYLPELAAHPAITIGHLLSHRHGIPDWRTIPGANARGAVGQSLAETVRWLSAQATEFEPGTRRKYGSSGYLILAYLVEQVTGESFFSYVTRHVLQPAGLSETTMLRPHGVVPGLVTGYVNSSEADGIAYPPSVDPRLGTGANSLISSASDLLRWSRWSADRLDLPVMTEEGRTVRWTAGMSGGYVVRIHEYVDEGFTVILLSNVFNAAFRPLMPGIVTILTGGTPPGNPPSPPFLLSERQRESLVGSFQCEGGFAFGIVNRDSGLGFTVPSSPDEVYATWAIGSNALFVPTDFARIEFARSPDGRRSAVYDGGFLARCTDAD